MVILFSGCQNNVIYTEVNIADKCTVNAEIADSLYKRVQGLSNRENLEENKGMLFVFDDSDYRTFNMQDMNFSIDIIFINNNKIVDINKNFKPGDDNYKSKSQADSVLEVQSGIIDEYNIKKGDLVDTNL
ncbi:MAG: DUF192 domain-containing protein [Patescibacteria group bacterium]